MEVKEQNNKAKDSMPSVERILTAIQERGFSPELPGFNISTMILKKL